MQVAWMQQLSRKRTQGCAAAAAAAAGLENNYTPATNFFSEDSLHLFAATETNKEQVLITLWSYEENK